MAARSNFTVELDLAATHLITLMHFHLTSGGGIAPHSRRLKHILSFPIFLGGGAAFVKPVKGHPEVSYCTLRTLKISVFIYCIYPTTLMHLHVTFGGQIARHSRCLRCICWKSKVSSNKRASKETAGGDGSKNKKQNQSTLFSDGDEVLRGLKRHTRESVSSFLAKVLYSGRVPFGQEDYLFQYSVFSVNKNHKTLVNQYDNRCISSASDAFHLKVLESRAGCSFWVEARGSWEWKSRQGGRQCKRCRGGYIFN